MSKVVRVQAGWRTPSQFTPSVETPKSTPVIKPRSIPVLSLCGVASTGKTTVAAALKEKYGDAIACMPSVARELFKQRGFKTEADMLSLSIDRLADFQVELFSTFCTKAKEFYALSCKTPKVRAVLWERSPFDYLAYILTHVGVEHVNAAQLRRDTLALLKSTSPQVFVFPYPCPWHLDGSKAAEDGVRAVNAKAYTSLNMNTAMVLSRYRDSVQPVHHLTTFDLDARVATIEAYVPKASSFAY